MNTIGHGWKISLHGEAGVHPLVSDVWGHGGVLDQTSDHSKSWVKVGKGPSLNVFGVEVIDGILEDVGEGLIPVTSIEADDVSLNSRVGNLNLLNGWEENEVFHSHVDVRLEVHGELDSGLIFGCCVGANKVKLGKSAIHVSDDDTMSGIELDWGLSVFGHQRETKSDFNVLAVVFSDLWHHLGDLRSDVFGGDHVREETLISNLDHGVNSALMNIELLTMGVCESWWVLVIDLNFVLGVDFLALWDVEETVHEELDKVRSFLQFWGGRHGEVQWELFSKGWYDEGVVTLVGYHLVNLINFGINEPTDLWKHVLDDRVDNT